MKIITLTLNPAFDIHCRLAHFSAGEENFVQERRCDAGGKGINIARACRANGMDCMAYVLLGRENGAEFEGSLRDEEIAYRAYYTEGRIRENLTLHSENAPETRISFEGFSADNSCLSAFEAMLEDTLDDTYFCLAGSIAAGIEKEKVIEFLLKLQKRGAKIILDSRSFSRDDLLKIRPFLIKPNLSELQVYVDRPCKSQEEIAACALDLHRAGIACVLVTMGKDGAILATNGLCFSANVPSLTAKSTVGAGDSTIAGYLYGISITEKTEERLRFALAFGCAACLREGTQPPCIEDIADFKEKIEVFRLYHKKSDLF